MERYKDSGGAFHRIKGTAMGVDVYDVVKTILQYTIAPMGYLIWCLWSRLSKLEQDQAVTQVMVDNIRDDIKEIRHGIDTLVSRQLK